MAATMFFEGTKQIQLYALGVNNSFWQVALFDNNPTLSAATVFGDFSLNTLSGGGPIYLTPSTWVDMSVSPNAEFTYSGLSWVLAPYVGGTTLYGFVVYDAALSVAIFGANFPTPYLVPSSGGAVVLLIDKKGQLC